MNHLILLVWRCICGFPWLGKLAACVPIVPRRNNTPEMTAILGIDAGMAYPDGQDETDRWVTFVISCVVPW
ncbi:MAG: hypothetical protein HUU55_21715 [Myxococcales bacterium]|nr:hypothetical protein [Myxococcales bacterium]